MHKTRIVWIQMTLVSVLLCLHSLPKVFLLEFTGGEFPTTFIATTSMVYIVSSCSLLSTVLVVKDVACTVEPLLGTADTVYQVTGGLLSGSVGGVHVTVMDEPEVAMADTPPGGVGARQSRRKIGAYWALDSFIRSFIYCTVP